MQSIFTFNESVTVRCNEKKPVKLSQSLPNNVVSQHNTKHIHLDGAICFFFFLLNLYTKIYHCTAAACKLLARTALCIWWGCSRLLGPSAINHILCTLFSVCKTGAKLHYICRTNQEPKMPCTAL